MSEGTPHEIHQLTLVIVKPDSVQAGHIGQILQVYELQGLRVLRIEGRYLSRDLVDLLYGEHKDKPFYAAHAEFMRSGMVVAVALGGKDAINCVRVLNGPTDPMKAREQQPNTIRATYGTVLPKNAVHGSENEDAAKRELRLFFPDWGRL